MSKENELFDVDALMDEKFGKEGTPERDKFREEAYNFCVGKMISNVRKQEKITQVELANRIGSSKSYISQIENGRVEPSACLFFKIMNALGMKIDICKQIVSIE